MTIKDGVICPDPMAYHPPSLKVHEAIAAFQALDDLAIPCALERDADGNYELRVNVEHWEATQISQTSATITHAAPEAHAPFLLGGHLTIR